MRPDDPWSEDDPAVRRLRDAIQRPQDGPGRPERTPQLPVSTEPAIAAPAESRRDRISDLVARVRAGDLSAVEMLRRLLG